MTHPRIKLIVAGVALVAAAGYLAFAGVRKAQVYYMEVDHFLASPEFHGRRVRVCGTVAEGSIERQADAAEIRFVLAGRDSRMPVRYSGALPDMFADGAEIVVEGRLGDGGVFDAAKLLTKCASKYKPADYPATAPAETAPEARP